MDKKEALESVIAHFQNKLTVYGGSLDEKHKQVYAIAIFACQDELSLMKKGE